jgi:hypothetical protein
MKYRDAVREHKAYAVVYITSKGRRVEVPFGSRTNAKGVAAEIRQRGLNAWVESSYHESNANQFARFQGNMGNGCHWYKPLPGC